METLKIALLGTAGVVGIGMITWGGIYLNGFFNAERESQRTRIFKESQAYTDGMRNQLNDLYLEYQKADTAGRIGISNVVRDTFASVDTVAYPAHLQNFLRETGAR